MYGLPQAGKLSQTQLIQHLSENGYTQCPNTPCLFRHCTREIMFCLVVDDFGVRYKTQADAEHLIDTLEKHDCKLKVRPLGDVYLGMAIPFDRPKRTVSISILHARLCQENIAKISTPSFYFPATAHPEHQRLHRPTVQQEAPNSLHRQIRENFPCSGH